MNKLYMNQTGGFPMTTNILNNLQNAYAIFNVLGELAGNMTILQGCTVTGNNITDGIVYINGEVLPFEGGAKSDKVFIKEDVEAKEFQDGSTKDVHFIRYVKFGVSSVNMYNWSDFKRIDDHLKLSEEINMLKKTTLIVDEIRMCAGDINSLPAGWYFCDGNNGTVDLRSRFIVGLDPTDSDYNTLGKHGGEKKHILSTDEMPSHSHAATTSSSGDHYHILENYGDSSGAANATELTRGNMFYGEVGRNNLQSINGTKHAGSHTHTVTVQNKGKGEAHENRPPYYTLAYIQYKGY